MGRLSDFVGKVIGKAADEIRADQARSRAARMRAQRQSAANDPKVGIKT